MSHFPLQTQKERQPRNSAHHIILKPGLQSLSPWEHGGVAKPSFCFSGTMPPSCSILLFPPRISRGTSRSLGYLHSWHAGRQLAHCTAAQGVLSQGPNWVIFPSRQCPLLCSCPVTHAQGMGDNHQELQDLALCKGRRCRTSCFCFPT